MANLPDKLLIVRHGSRLDETLPAAVFKDLDVGFDTPLTYGGFKQSQALGAHIAQLLLLPGNPDRRKKRIIIHSSPFTRCVQTSIGIAAGMAQVVAPIANGTNLEEAAGRRSTLTYPYSPIVLRLEPWLGEWMTEKYFGHWDAALLRSSEIVLRARDLLNGQAEAEGIQIDPSMAKRNNEQTKQDKHTEKAELVVPIRAVASIGRATYQSPKPNHAVLSSAAIPAGYVNHARDACIEFDETWMGLRDGGVYGERWSTFHARMGSGLHELLQWYQIHQNDDSRPKIAESLIRQEPATTSQSEGTTTEAALLANYKSVGASEVVPQERAMHNSNQQSDQPGIAHSLQSMSMHEKELEMTESEDEVILILVTHAGGCNKLLHFLTQRPVLIDFPPSSLILATKNSDASNSELTTYLDKHYSTLLQASTDHLNPAAKFQTIRDLATRRSQPLRQSRSSSRSNRRSTLTTVPPVVTADMAGLWGQGTPLESGSVSASEIPVRVGMGLWRPNGGTPVRRATMNHLEGSSD